MSKKVPKGQHFHLHDPAFLPTQTARRRSWLGGLVVLTTLTIVVIQLFNLQFVQASQLRTKASRQLTIKETLQAMRGSIADRNDRVLATTEDSRALTFQPVIVRKQLDEEHAKDAQKPTTEQYLSALATDIKNYIPETDYDTVLAKLNSDNSFEYLAKPVSPEIAYEIQKKYPTVGSEMYPTRIYPARSVAGNILGITRADGPGLEGMELSLDSRLAGMNGGRKYDRAEDGTIIPGSIRDYYPAKNGDKITLTLDSELQYHVQGVLDDAVRVSGARSAQAVVLDSASGEILAMANNATFDPSQGTQGLMTKAMLNPSVEGPFEPGSVNKVVTAAGIIENNLASPDEVLNVPGDIHMGSITVHDAWTHGTAPYTVTGIFGKSSNVGTLMLAQRLGGEKFYQLARKFGIGTRTGVELAGESPGSIPPLNQWSGATFANLPIGQGLSMTLLQMTSMYQTIANNGVRISPRIIKKITSNDGADQELPLPVSTQVVSEKTAKTVRTMFEAVVQNDPTGVQRGSGSSAAIDGYQISGKTGTGQQWDNSIHKYSDSKYNITFAGIAPADNPRFVIGIMLDAPHRNPNGSASLSAAPLFHDIASWLLNHYQVPLSTKEAPHFILQKQ